ncbi:hypothetical protein FPZ43_02620 [Mucilaginibacter pallidiroseus]|uniref:Uncharacterized protein n=1 Tax=Mucilaginibacter pallidiroseus TaxID=2599295 RepID=A0A563UJC7_9SPHI|nr:hypothetical protein [Mucilaginibacter pallidiroseus]TWR31388.1 hypothetical protein FPZ43_02620 [Mucilaginibacter pallidiroseus]
MRERLWYELTQAKHHACYCVLLYAKKKRLLGYFNVFTLAMSSAGIMGWPMWKTIPLVACIIISAVQLLKLLQNHLIPSEKQLDELHIVIEFYDEYFLKLEKLWFDYDCEKLNEDDVSHQYYKIKKTEKSINKIVNSILKSVDTKIKETADEETLNYINRVFNLTN